MAIIKIKQSLLDIANSVKPTTTLEEVYEQLKQKGSHYLHVRSLSPK